MCGEYAGSLPVLGERNMMLTFQAFRVNGAVTEFSLSPSFRGHLQESDLTMRTMGFSPSTSIIPQGHLWVPMATTCIQTSTTHLQCPSMPRGLQHRPQQLPSTHSPIPQGHCAPQPQVRLFSIVPRGTAVSGSDFSCGLLFPLCCH